MLARARRHVFTLPPRQAIVAAVAAHAALFVALVAFGPALRMDGGGRAAAPLAIALRTSADDGADAAAEHAIPRQSALESALATDPRWTAPLDALLPADLPAPSGDEMTGYSALWDVELLRTVHAEPAAPEPPRPGARASGAAALAATRRAARDAIRPAARPGPALGLASAPRGSAPGPSDEGTPGATSAAPRDGATPAGGRRIGARPDPRACAKPGYPRRAERARLAGRVLLRIAVSAKGEVTAVVVSESSGHAILDEAAVAAVKDWRFLPAEDDGVRIATTVLLPVRFDAPR
jgi:periplasmic protein TonB